MIILVKVLLSAVIIFSMVTVFIVLADDITHFKYDWLDEITDMVVNAYLIFTYVFLIGLFVSIGALLIWSIWT